MLVIIVNMHFKDLNVNFFFKLENGFSLISIKPAKGVFVCLSFLSILAMTT